MSEVVHDVTEDLSRPPPNKINIGLHVILACPLEDLGFAVNILPHQPNENQTTGT
jgi:hypothetical protein